MPWINQSQAPEGKALSRAIVFVHGLNGSEATWMGEDLRFMERLKEIPLLCDQFGFFIFRYHTKIFEMGCLKRLMAIRPGQKAPDVDDQFNTGIRKISDEFRSGLREILRDYDCIVLITHSMGGLVGKRCLVDMGEDLGRIALYVSLSVPHLGSGLGKVGSDLTGNPQTLDLELFGEFVTDLQNRFDNLPDPPKAIFQVGSNDTVVPEPSAIPGGVLDDDRIYTSDNHYSILQVQDPTVNATFMRIVEELEALLKTPPCNDPDGVGVGDEDGE